MLCDKCQEREATIFTTNVIGGVSEQLNLCDECFADSEPTMSGQITAALQDGCCYCGAEPQCSAPSLTMPDGSQKIRMACKQCADEYFTSLRLKIPGFGQAPVTEDQVSAMRDLPAILSDLEQHMKNWVTDRRKL